MNNFNSFIIVFEKKMHVPRQNDFKMVLNMLKIMKFFGIAPLTPKFKIFLIIIIIGLIFLAQVVMRMSIIYHSHSTKPLHSKLIILRGFSQIFLVLYCLVWFPFFNKNLHDDLNTSLNDLENCTVEHNAMQRKEVEVSIRISLILGLFFAKIIAYLNASIHGNYKFLLINIFDLPSMFYVFLIIINYVTITYWIKNKYYFFNKMIVNICKKKHTNFDERMNEIIGCLDSAHRVVKQFNKLFGFVIFLCHLLMVFYNMVSILFCLDLHTTILGRERFIFPVPYTVSEIFLSKISNADI